MSILQYPERADTSDDAFADMAGLRQTFSRELSPVNPTAPCGSRAGASTTIVCRQQVKELEADRNKLMAEGALSCRAHPEQGFAGGAVLHGPLVFCIMPMFGRGRSTLVGPVLVLQTVNLGPRALRPADAVDSPELFAYVDACRSPLLSLDHDLAVGIDLESSRIRARVAGTSSE